MFDSPSRGALALAAGALLNACAVGPSRQGAPAPVTVDVVIYGGTSAGIACAVRLARLGREVVVVSPDTHIGGLTSSGLGWTDSGEKAVIGGLAREFYGRIWQHYASGDAWRWQTRDEYGGRGQGSPAVDGASRTMWVFEPHAAEAVFEDLVAEAGVRIDRDEWLDREHGVSREGARIAAIRTLSGTEYRAQVFIDATYEGDLMAAAGVTYAVGRESSSAYGEPWNGAQPDARHHGHHFDSTVANPVDPYVLPGDPSSGLIDGIDAEPPAPRGTGDHRVQAYCFRMCLTDHPENRALFEEPEGYQPARYELMARTFEAGWRDTLPPSDPIPNRKTDANNHGPMSTDHIGANYAYPEASYAERRAIVRDHELYQKGLFYFLRTSPRVPEATRSQMSRWGLAADEFTDNGHWPYRLYIREARRMVSDTVVTEADVLGKRAVTEPIAMGSYQMDSHNVRRYVTAEGAVENEGDLAVRPDGPYAIPYGAISPRREECANLLVPVCVSSSHIAYGSIRMEPVFMILGDSAAHAAHLAIEGRCAVQDVPYGALAGALREVGQVLETPPALEQAREARSAKEAQRSVLLSSLPGVVMDDVTATLTGSWQTSVASDRFVGPSYRHDGNAGTPGPRAIFRSKPLEAGAFDLRLGFPYGNNRATKVRVTVRTGDSEPVEMTVDQRRRPPIDGLWVSLGELRVKAGEDVTVTVHGGASDGYVVADAVQLLPR